MLQHGVRCGVPGKPTSYDDNLRHMIFFRYGVVRDGEEEKKENELRVCQKIKRELGKYIITLALLSEESVCTPPGGQSAYPTPFFVSPLSNFVVLISNGVNSTQRQLESA